MTRHKLKLQRQRSAEGRIVRWHGPLAVLAVLAFLPALLSAIARPAAAARLQLRVRTELSLEWLLRDGALQVSGRLVDSAGRGVAQAPVVVAAVVQGADRAVTSAVTDDQGRWTCQTGLGGLEVGAAVHVEAEFAGDASRGEARAETAFDIAKPQTQLQLLGAQKRWSSAGPPWSLALQVRTMQADGQPGAPLVGAEVDLLLDGKPFLHLRSDSRGQLTAQRPLEALGALGPHRLSALLLEGVTHNPTALHWTIESVAALEVRLEAHPGRDGDGPCGEGDWCVQGRVTLAGSNQPVQDAAIAVFSAQRQIGALTSDAEGRFAAVLRGQALRQLLRQERIEVVAQASVGKPWIESGWSEVITLQLAPPPRWVEWTGGAALVLLAAAAGVRQWLKKRRQAEQLRRAEAEQAGLPPENLVAGVALEGGSRTLSGAVFHGETGRPCAAQLWLASQGQAPRQLASADGHFSEVGLADGAYVLRVELAEHDPLVLELSVPHGGAFEGCELRPASCRALVRGSFASALRRMTGAGVDWGRETPRIAEPRWAQHSRRGRLEIRDAVKSTERALYGPHTPPELVDEVRQAISRVDEVQK